MMEKDLQQWIDQILFVVVLYKKDPCTSEGLLSLIGSMRANNLTGHFFIYDNSPFTQAQEADRLKDLYPGYSFAYRHDPYNSGISKAYNTGGAFAREKGLSYLFFSDQDSGFGSDLILKYYQAYCSCDRLHCWVPYVYLSNKKLLSPCRFFLTRGFHVSNIREGLNSFDHYSAINSGILISLDLFVRAGGYNEKTPLDYADFNFIERVKKNDSRFFLVNTTVKQDFSNEQSDPSVLENRFKYYCQGAKGFEKQIYQYPIWLFQLLIRASVLSIRTRKFSFFRIVITEFVC